MIASCEACSEDAELPFDYILDRLTGSDPTVTDRFKSTGEMLAVRRGDYGEDARWIGTQNNARAKRPAEIERTRAESQHIRGVAYFDYPPCGFCLHTGGYFVASGTVGPLTIVR